MRLASRWRRRLMMTDDCCCCCCYSPSSCTLCVLLLSLYGPEYVSILCRRCVLGTGFVFHLALLLHSLPALHDHAEHIPQLQSHIFYFTYIVCIVYLNVPASWTLYPCILPTAQQQQRAGHTRHARGPSFHLRTYLRPIRANNARAKKKKKNHAAGMGGNT